MFVINETVSTKCKTLKFCKYDGLGNKIILIRFPAGQSDMGGCQSAADGTVNEPRKVELGAGSKFKKLEKHTFDLPPLLAAKLELVSSSGKNVDNNRQGDGLHYCQPFFADPGLVYGAGCGQQFRL